jgi:hypothetical protein
LSRIRSIEIKHSILSWLLLRSWNQLITDAKGLVSSKPNRSERGERLHSGVSPIDPEPHVLGDLHLWNDIVMKFPLKSVEG